MRIFLVGMAAFSLIFGLGNELSAANIVTNGGFETGDSTGWTVHDCTVGCATSPGPGWGVNAVNPQSGTYSAATPCTGSGCLDPVTGAYISQILVTTAGDAYSLTFWSDAGTSTPSELDIFWDGSLVLAIPDGPVGYTQYTVSNLVATSAGTLLQFNGRQDPSTLYLDTVDVESTGVASPSPEPASLLLMATALLGLGFAATRRKACPARARG